MREADLVLLNSCSLKNGGPEWWTGGDTCGRQLCGEDREDDIVCSLPDWKTEIKVDDWRTFRVYILALIDFDVILYLKSQGEGQVGIGCIYLETRPKIGLK